MKLSYIMVIYFLFSKDIKIKVNFSYNTIITLYSSDDRKSIIRSNNYLKLLHLFVFIL